MKLYLKVLKFVQPFWKAILFSFLLTFLYVFFNNVSLWVSVDFIREIFSPEYVETGQVYTVPDSTVKTEIIDTVTTSAPSMTDIVKNNTKSSRIYDKINNYIKHIIVRDSKKGTLLSVCVVIFLAFLFKNITDYSKRVVVNYVVLNIIVSIRNQLHQKILRLPLGWFQKKHTGILTSIVFNDVKSLRIVFNNSFGKMILSPLQILTNVVIMVMISWRLSIVTFIIVPLSTYIIVKIGKSMRRRSKRVLKQMANVYTVFQEAVSAIRVVKIFSGEKKEYEKFHRENELFFKKRFRANKLKYATSPINEVLLVTILVFLLWYGGNQIYDHQGLKPEDFIRFLVFLFTLFQPIKDLSGINNIIQSGMAAAERIFTVLDAEPEIYEKKDAVELKGFNSKIIFKDVSFKYEENLPYAVEKINLEIKKGELVAFVGPSGSGKTTLINLLPRFYDVSEGSILIDDSDIRNITLTSLRVNMSMVTQDTILFNDTVRMNIAYGTENASEEDIIEAAKVANAWEFIEKLDKGLDTHIGEKGALLSGGQKQRLAIARAILNNPPILILDEATSALDTESERLVQESIDKLLADRTVLVIAHRLSTVTSADKIVVMNQGKIEAVGKHDELLLKSKTYAALSKEQMIGK